MCEHAVKMEADLREIEERVSNLGRWDLPSMWIVLAGNRIGLVNIPSFYYDLYPDPVDLMKVLTEGQRRENEELKQTGTLYRDAHPHEASSGEPHAVVMVTESWGLEGVGLDGYVKLVAALPDDERSRLVAEYGRVPISVLPGAREQRNVIGLCWDGTVHSLIRYRDTDELKYQVESAGGGYLTGRLIHGLIDWVFEIKHAWQHDRRLDEERGA